jgi:hypothetical protein
MDPDEILRIAKDIRASRLSFPERKSHYGFMYPKFVEEYPTLFDIACQARTDEALSHLEYMIAQWKKVKNGSVTQYDASIKVGARLVDTYVKPALKNVPPSISTSTSSSSSSSSSAPSK